MNKSKYFFVYFLGLLFIQCLFYLIQIQSADRLTSSLRSLLSHEVKTQNPYIISQTISEMEKIGLFKCSKLTQIWPTHFVFSDTRYNNNCNLPKTFLLEGIHKKVLLKSVNGGDWEFQYTSLLPRYFIFSLWTSRIILLIFIFLVFKLRSKELENTTRLLHEQKRHASELQNSSMQVAHDIRSPLVALQMALEYPDSENNFLLQKSVKRIEDIINVISSNYSDTLNSKKSIIFLPTLIDEMITEKRMQYKNHSNVSIDSNINDNFFDVFININPRELKRIISNLVNNSVEALKNDGQIKINLSCTTSHAIFLINDNGCGIPKHILPKVFERGLSFGKENGQGLGLVHAKDFLNENNSDIKIDSKVNQGTTLTLTMPISTTPSWFGKHININQKNSIVIVEDDETVHHVWKRRFRDFQIPLHHFYNPTDLLVWKKDNPRENSFYLIDFEYHKIETNGIDLICKLQIENQSLLTTGHFDDKNVIDLCIKNNVKLIPKKLSKTIPIIHDSYPRYSAVHIDDDYLIRKVWKIMAKKKGIRLLSLSNFENFFQHSKDLPKNIPIYMDYNLGKELPTGLDNAERLNQNLFFEIHITTGHDPSYFGNQPIIKSFLGKTPPWS